MAKKETIALGVDHAGYNAKKKVIKILQDAGYGVIDFGANTAQSVDYPDYASKVAKAVASKKADRGILMCGSGTGMAMAANKVRGIRAASVWSAATARLSREHNWSNILCLSTRFSTAKLREKLIKIWLSTPPDKGGRHERRIKKISKLEAKR